MGQYAVQPWIRVINPKGEKAVWKHRINVFKANIRSRLVKYTVRLHRNSVLNELQIITSLFTDVMVCWVRALHKLLKQ